MELFPRASSECPPSQLSPNQTKSIAYRRCWWESGERHCASTGTTSTATAPARRESIAWNIGVVPRNGTRRQAQQRQRSRSLAGPKNTGQVGSGLHRCLHAGRVAWRRASGLQSTAHPRAARPRPWPKICGGLHPLGFLDHPKCRRVEASPPVVVRHCRSTGVAAGVPDAGIVKRASPSVPRDHVLIGFVVTRLRTGRHSHRRIYPFSLGNLRSSGAGLGC